METTAENSNTSRGCPTLLGLLDICVKQVRNIKGPPDAYKNASDPRGALFIANYKEFNDECYRTRKSSEKDVKYLEKLFSQMGYEVVEGIREKCTKVETIAAMQSFSKHKIHNEVDSMILAVMSHGINKNTFITSDGEFVTSQEVYKIFSDDNCPALKGKPKLFIFLHCRGNNKHSSSQQTRYSHTPPEEPDASVSDTILLYSTLSGEVHYRHEEHGSPYIHQICQVFMEKAWQSEFETLMEEVEEGMAKYKFNGDTQRCEYKLKGKNSDLYFNPETLVKDEYLKKQLHKELSGYTTDCCTVEIKSSKLNMPPTEEKHVLLINNLDGCSSDMISIKNLFNTLGYNVNGPHTNVTYEKLKEVINAFKKKDHGESTFIVLYGDGFNECFLTSDHYAIYFSDLQREFNDRHCPNLSKRPKIFITNLCYYKGELKNECKYQLESQMCHQEEMDYDSQACLVDENTEKSMKCINYLQDERDMFFLNVEIVGSHCEKGSLLTEAFCQILKENKSPQYLMKIMQSVSRRLDKLKVGREEKYICEIAKIQFPSQWQIRGSADLLSIIELPDTSMPLRLTKKRKRDYTSR